MRQFVLVREIDETGVSGTGPVAEGVQFDDGHVAMRWSVGDSRSVSVWDSIDDMIAVHGHDGKTEVFWPALYKWEFNRSDETRPHTTHHSQCSCFELVEVNARG